VNPVLTNLPPLVAERIGYDPAKAAQAEQVEAERVRRSKELAAARQKYLASLAGPVQTVRCLAIYDIYGQCSLQTSNGVVRAYVVDLPPAVGNYFQQLAAAENAVNGTKENIERLKGDLLAAENSTTLNIAGGGDAGYSMVRENTLRTQLANAREFLPQAQETLRQLKLENGAASFSAFNTGLTDNGIQRWQAVP
jgi:hypothetical protein